MSAVRVPAGVLARELQDPGPGEHLWAWLVAFSMSDDAARRMAEGLDPGDVLLDHENMLGAPQPGCYKCEQPFSRRTYYRKCTGSMDLQ